MWGINTLWFSECINNSKEWFICVNFTRTKESNDEIQSYVFLEWAVVIIPRTLSLPWLSLGLWASQSASFLEPDTLFLSFQVYFVSSSNCIYFVALHQSSSRLVVGFIQRLLTGGLGLNVVTWWCMATTGSRFHKSKATFLNLPMKDLSVSFLVED